MMEAKLTMKIFLSPKKDNRFTAIIISLIFSCIVLIHNQPTNGDAAVYFRSSIAYSEGGISAAIYYYAWPFFSIVLHYVSRLTSLSLLNSGLLINTVLCALLVWGFITIIKELGGNYQTQLIAAVVILLYPYINHFRDNILRDMGYWTFYILAFLYLLRFSAAHRWRYAILWNIAIALATLFRIEGILFAAFAPLFILFKPTLRLPARIGNCLKIYMIPIAIVIAGLITLYSIGTLDFLQGSRVSELLKQIQGGGSKILSALELASTQASTYVLDFYSRHNGLVFVLGGLLGILCNQIVVNLGPVYAILTLHGFLGRRTAFTWDGKAIIVSFATINLLLFAWFMTQHLFISKRYTTAFSLLLLLFVVYSISGIIENYQRKRSMGKGALMLLLILALCYNFIGSLGHFGTNKTYLVEAGQWLKAHSSSKHPIYSNSAQILLYAGRTGNKAWDIDTNKINLTDPEFLGNPEKIETNIVINKHLFRGQTEKMINVLLKSSTPYDYIVLELSRHRSNKIADELEEKLDVERMKVFSNKKGDRVYIYKAVD